MEKIVLIDGNSLINRAFYAMPLLTTKKGVYTNAVYGFMNMFFKMLGEEKPTCCAVAFDLKAPTFRHKMYSEYKGTRKPMPEELRPQIALLKETLNLMGVKTVEKEGFEADDIIGTIAKHTRIKTVIITGDKDSFQLVDDETEVHFTKRGITDTEAYTAENFYEKTGLYPSQIIHLKALMGDSSDNIPGVEGVGEKTAKTLLQTYGDVDGVYAHIDDIKGKLKEKIINGKDLCYLSKTLATIDTDCDVDTDIESMRIKTPFGLNVKEKFIELEFKSLYSREELFAADEKGNTKDNVKTQRVKTEKVTDIAKINAQTLAVVLEERAVFVSDGKTEWIVPVRIELMDEGISLSEAYAMLAELFNKPITVILFGKKEFRHKATGVINADNKAKIEDVSLIKYLVDYGGGAETLKDVVTAYGYDGSNPAFALFEIYNMLYPKLASEGVEKLYSDMELPLSDLLFDMEEQGFKIDAVALDSLGEEYSATLASLEAEIREYAENPTLNVNSPRQLGEVLFEKLKLGKGKKTKSGYSTSAEVIEGLEDKHPIVPLILRYRKIQKLSSTYIEGFKPLIDKKTGLIKTSFNQTVTSTGRLSSKEPNLQNIPVRDEEGKKLRKFFVPVDENHILVSADYSQIELRLMAAFSGCRGLISAFKEGKDVHSETAAKVFNVPQNEVTQEMRRAAKAVNFGIIYGISEYGLAKNLKTSATQAKSYIDSYFREYPEVKTYMKNLVDFAKEKGYAVTMFGRRRYISEINASNYMLRQFGERAAMNMPLQGSSADIIKLAMLKVDEKLKQEGLASRIILQIHDELIIDALKSERERVEKILVSEMESAVSLAVPLTVSLGVGENWYDAK